MNKGLYGIVQGRGLHTGLFSFPRNEYGDAIGRIPPSSDYIAWYDSSQFETLTITSDTISQWNDLSANAYHLTQASSANRPGYGAARLRRINGITVPDFDGGDEMASSCPTDRPCSRFAVVVKDDTSIEWLFGTTDNLSIKFLCDDTLESRTPAGTSAGALSGVLQAGTNRPYMLAQVLDAGSELIHYMNDGKQVFSNSGGGNSALILGHTNEAGNQWTGGIGEVLMYDRRLTDEEIADTYAYLRAKWAIP